MGYVVIVILTLFGLGAIPFGMDHLDRRLAGGAGGPTGWRGDRGAEGRACALTRSTAPTRPAGRVALGCAHGTATPSGVVHGRTAGLHGPLTVATPLPRPRHGPSR